MYNVVWDPYGARILAGETTLHYGTPATWADWEEWVKTSGFEIVSETISETPPAPGARRGVIRADVRRISH